MASRIGPIILLNGTSSSGKSTLAQALRLALEPQFHFTRLTSSPMKGFARSIRKYAWHGDKHSSMGLIGRYLLLQVQEWIF